MTEPNDLNARMSALEERMNTSYERLRADLAGRDTAFERLRADFADFGKQAAERDAARSRRETWLVVFLVATVIGAAGLVIAILG